MTIIIIILVIIIIMYFSTIKLDIKNLIISNDLIIKRDKVIVKIQIYFLNKIKIVEIKLKNKRIKEKYIKNTINKVFIEKFDKNIFNTKEKIKILKKVKLKIEALRYNFNILFGDKLTYCIELSFKLSFSIRKVLKKV